MARDFNWGLYLGFESISVPVKVGRVCSNAYIFFIFLETLYSADNKNNFWGFFCMYIYCVRERKRP